MLRVVLLPNVHVAENTCPLIRIRKPMYNFELALVARFMVSKLYIRLRIRIRYLCRFHPTFSWDLQLILRV